MQGGRRPAGQKLSETLNVRCESEGLETQAAEGRHQAAGKPRNP